MTRPEPRRTRTARGNRPATLRALGVPVPVQIRAGADGLPAHIARRGGAWQHVEQVDDVWRVAEEWWREEPQERTYVRVILEGGAPLTLFQDGRSRHWFEQRYS